MNQSVCSDLLSVSVVIVNYNAGDLLADCVGCVLNHVRQVIVVDNASSDASLEMLSEKCVQADNLQIIHLQRNSGYAAGCNIGLAGATQPYILFLNPDCLLDARALRYMLTVIGLNEKIGMVGARLINPDGTEQRGSRRTIPTPWRSFVYAFGLNRFAQRWPRLFADFNQNGRQLPDAPIDVEAISGALMLMKREAIDDVGRWDEKYFLHCEDLDMCMRFRQKGWKIVFVPDTSIVHYQGTCSASSYLLVEWHKHRSMNVFYKKFFRHQYPGLLMWMVKAAVWFRFGVLSAVHGFRRVKKGLSF